MRCRIRKGPLALGAITGAVLLGGSTTAIWQMGTDPADATITAGSFGLEGVAPTSWYSVGAGDQIVPGLTGQRLESLSGVSLEVGQTVAAVWDTEIVLEGDNLVARLSLHLDGDPCPTGAALRHTYKLYADSAGDGVFDQRLASQTILPGHGTLAHFTASTSGQDDGLSDASDQVTALPDSGRLPVRVIALSQRVPGNTEAGAQSLPGASLLLEQIRSQPGGQFEAEETFGQAPQMDQWNPAACLPETDGATESTQPMLFLQGGEFGALQLIPPPTPPSMTLGDGRVVIDLRVPQSQWVNHGQLLIDALDTSQDYDLVVTSTVNGSTARLESVLAFGDDYWHGFEAFNTGQNGFVTNRFEILWGYVVAAGLEFSPQDTWTISIVGARDSHIPARADIRYDQVRTLETQHLRWFTEEEWFPQPPWWW